MGQPLAPAERWHALAARFRLLGTQGLVGMAISRHRHGALGRAGARRTTRRWCACSAASNGRSASTARSATTARTAPPGPRPRWAARGFTGVKAKIGYPDVQEDLAVVRAIRDAVGPSVAIMVDYNQSLTPADAIGRIRVLEGEGLAWVEEPTLAHDFDGHAQVAQAVDTPIQCGENWWGPQDMAHAIRARASDVVMPDVMKMLRRHRLAEGRGAGRGAPACASRRHLWSEVSAQLLSLTPMAHWLEYCDWWNPILAAPLRVEQGLSRIDGVVGTGVEWNEAAVQRCLA